MSLYLLKATIEYLETIKSSPEVKTALDSLKKVVSNIENPTIQEENKPPVKNSVSLADLPLEKQQRIMIFIFQHCMGVQKNQTLPPVIPNLIEGVQQQVAHKMKINITPDVVGSLFVSLIEAGYFLPVRNENFETIGYKVAKSQINFI